MSESVHGHRVLEMIAEARHPLTREALLRAADERFGPEARFHTCSADGLSAETLLAFFEERGKYTVRGGFIVSSPDAVCDHE